MTTTAKTKPTKAIVGSIITFIDGTLLLLEQSIPDPTLKLWASMITGVLGVAANAFGIFTTTNQPVETPEHSTETPAAPTTPPTVGL